jgi:hypothetical protein
MHCRICDRLTAFVRCLKCGHWVCLFWGCSKIGQRGKGYRVACYPACILRKVAPRAELVKRLTREERLALAWSWVLGPLADMRRRPLKRWSP